METNETFYLSILKNELSKRQRVNTSYSLRAFAKDLDIDSSNLSAVLRQKRNLPTHRAEKIAGRLRLSPKKSALFINSTLRKKIRLDNIEITKEADKKYLLDEMYYHVISEWEYYGFLQLLNTKDFNPDIDWIAKRLDITSNRADVVVSDLIKLKLIEKDSEKGYKRLANSLETSDDVESNALHKSHVECLDLAKQKLDEVDVKSRDFSSVTIAIDPDKLPEAKAIIREFQEKLYSLMSNERSREVYIFNSQFFPITKDVK